MGIGSERASASAAALMRAEELLAFLGGGASRLDERSRAILLEVAHAQLTGGPLHPSTLHRHGRFGSVVTVRVCVKRLIENGLMRLVPNPANQRQRHLTVDENVLESIETTARELARLGAGAPGSAEPTIDLKTR